MINWGKVSKKNYELAHKIAIRAKEKNPENEDVMSTEMDIVATHIGGCPLNMEKLLGFDDFNFFHDIFGIRKCLDRETGKLEGYFLPRCAV